MTAAHCLAAVSDLLTPDGRLVFTRDVRVGVACGPDLSAPARQVEVTCAQLHPRFNPRSLEYDAALLRLADDIEGAIELGEDDVAPGECGVVAGWGETGSGHGTSRLSWARMHVGSDDACSREVSAGVVGRPHLMFAAGGDEGRCPEFPRAAVRKGDSGSGFVVTRGGRPRLGGIVSWSASAPGDANAPLVFTRTFPMTDWIARETRRFRRPEL